jgi:RNA polymerase sigma factor (sigma-70 family)
MEPTDSELVARCLEAKEAFAELYRRHAPSLFAFLKGMHRGDEHAAADSLQDTFLRAFTALRRFDRSRPLRPWLLAIAANVARDAIARTRRIEVREELPEHATQDPADSPSGTAAASDACWRLLDRVAGRLPERAIAAFLLARIQGLSYAEIAAIHECSPATVKRDLADALAALSGAALELGLV